MQAVTFSKYEGDEARGEQRLIEEHLYNLIIQRMVHKEFETIARDAIYEKGRLMSRPQITFGLNLRDPMHLLLYETLMKAIREETRVVAEQAIRNHATEVLELRVMNEWILSFSVVGRLCA